MTSPKERAQALLKEYESDIRSEFLGEELWLARSLIKAIEALEKYTEHDTYKANVGDYVPCRLAYETLRHISGE